MSDRVKDRIAANAKPFLRPDEEVEQAFSAQTIHPAWFALGILPYLLIVQYRSVVVTNQRILVCDAGKSQVAAKSLLREFPRKTLIGPPHGIVYKTDALGERLYFTTVMHKRISASDAGITKLDGR